MIDPTTVITYPTTITDRNGETISVGDPVRVHMDGTVHDGYHLEHINHKGNTLVGRGGAYAHHPALRARPNQLEKA